MNENIEQDFLRFLRHEAMFRNTSQEIVLKVIKNEMSEM